MAQFENMLFALIAVYLIAYLIGAVPFSFLIGKMWGTDIRKVGSGNLGATNVWRTCGKFAGSLAYLADIGKGILAFYAVNFFLSQQHLTTELNSHAVTAAYFMPILGHTYSVFMKFKGGKGVATAAGVLLCLTPYPAAAAVVFFLTVFILSRIISLSSILSAFLYPVLVYLHPHFSQRFQMSDTENGERSLLLGLSILLSGFIIYKHRSNIVRLLKGEEHSFRKQEKN